MTKPRPPVDRVVEESSLIGPWGWLLIVAGLGIVIVGSRSVAKVFRGLDQSATQHLPSESSTARPAE